MTAQAPADLTAANAGAGSCVDCGLPDIGQPMTGRRRVLCHACRIRRAARGRLRQARELFTEIDDDELVALIDHAIQRAGPIPSTEPH